MSVECVLSDRFRLSGIIPDKYGPAMASLHKYLPSGTLAVRQKWPDNLSYNPASLWHGLQSDRSGNTFCDSKEQSWISCSHIRERHSQIHALSLHRYRSSVHGQYPSIPVLCSRLHNPMKPDWLPGLQFARKCS